jgi:hypothetical protein
MRNGLTITGLMLAGAMTLNAQAPQAPQTTPQTPPAPPAASQPAPDRQTPATERPVSDSARAQAQAAQVITIAGCLKEEKDVPGLKPNVAERAGVSEDYILTNVKMAASSKVSGIALATRYEVEGPSNDELKKHINHQVEITGTITQPTTTGSDDTPDFKATAVKMVAATCPAQ